MRGTLRTLNICLTGQAYRFTLVSVKNSFPISASATSLILSFFWNKWTCKILYPTIWQTHLFWERVPPMCITEGYRHWKVYRRKPFFRRCRGTESRAAAGRPSSNWDCPTISELWLLGHQNKRKRTVLYLPAPGADWKIFPLNEEQRDFLEHGWIEAVSFV